MGQPKINLVGKRSGRLIVVRYVGGNWASWECKCDCGNLVVVPGCNLRSIRKPTKSCGCFLKDWNLIHKMKHGFFGTPEYKTWDSIKQRCLNSAAGDFPRYGGRGITVCDRWKDSFPNFLADMGPRPIGTSIERKDNSKGYSPDNCYWATPTEQNRNRATVTLYAFEAYEIRALYSTGQFTQKELAEIYAVSKSVVQTIASGRSWKNV